MSKKNIAFLYGMASMMAGLHSDYPARRENLTDGKVIKDNSEEIRKRYLDNLKKKGVKEYQYGEVTILARTKETADKKARKKGLI